MHPFAANDKKNLDTVSSLKRALGIPNHPTQPDVIWKQDRVKAYTPDKESAEILAEIFNLYATGQLGRFTRRKLFNPGAIPRSVAVEESLDVPEAYYATVEVADANIFRTRMQQVIDRHIAPDRRNRNR